MLAEHVAFTARRGAGAPRGCASCASAALARFAALGLPDGAAGGMALHQRRADRGDDVPAGDDAPTNAAELAARVSIPSDRRRATRHSQRPLRARAVRRRARCRSACVVGSLRDAPATHPHERTSRPDRRGSSAVRRAQHRVPRGRRVHRRPARTPSSTDPIHIVVHQRRRRADDGPSADADRGGRAQPGARSPDLLGAAGECHLTNAVTEVSLGESASSISTPISARPTRPITSRPCTCTLQRNATFRSRAVTLGGSFCATTSCAVLGGEGAHCALDGCYLVDGERLVDNHTTIDHATPHCTSHELYKGILDGKCARGVQRPDHRARGRAENRRQADQPRAAAVGRRA